jgi:hypothetical protein
MGGGTALLSSAANVGGKVVVGDEVGWTDLRTVTLETVTGAAGGALGAGVAARITPYIAPALTRSIMASGTLRVAEPALAATVNGIVAGSSAGVVQGAVMDGIRVLDRRATFEQLLRNVVANLIAGGIIGAIAGRLSGTPPGGPPPPSGGPPPTSGGPSTQNVLVVGAETAGEFAWASEVAATGQQVQGHRAGGEGRGVRPRAGRRRGRVTVVNPVITPEAQASTARGGTVVRGTVESLPQRAAYTMIREDFPFPLGRAFHTLEGVAATQQGVQVTGR